MPHQASSSTMELEGIRYSRVTEANEEVKVVELINFIESTLKLMEDESYQFKVDLEAALPIAHLLQFVREPFEAHVAFERFTKAVDGFIEEYIIWSKDDALKEHLIPWLEHYKSTSERTEMCYGEELHQAPINLLKLIPEGPFKINKLDLGTRCRIFVRFLWQGFSE
jgi:hypothetical protein